MWENALSSNVKESEKKKILHLSLYSDPCGVYSGLRPILHPSFADVCFCAILITNQPTNQKPHMAESITSAELVIVSLVCCNYLSFKFKK